MKILLLMVLVLLAPPTKAEPICSPRSQGTALIVIDMQRYFLTRGGHEKTEHNVLKTQRVQRAQLAAIRQARASRMPIVFLEYKDCGETNSELKDAVRDYRNTRFIIKDTDGMFADGNIGKAELIDHLRGQNIGRLLIAGANGGACVEASIRGAVDGGCGVVALTDAIADFNYADFIQPYRGHYSAISSSCASCTFHEASIVQDSFEDNLLPHSRELSSVPPKGSHE